LKKLDYYIEPDRESPIYEEIECFLQSTPRGHVSANAHIHSSVELIYVQQGSYTVFLNDREYSVNTGDLILFCSHTIHRILATGEGINSYYVIKAKPSLLFALSSGKLNTPCMIRFVLGRENTRVLWTAETLQGSRILPTLRALTEEYHAGKYHKEFALKLRILDLLIAILRDGEVQHSEGPTGADSGIAEIIYDVLLYLQRNYANDIDEASIAKERGISYSYFSRNFRELTGKSFKNYLNRIRIDHGEQLLLTTSKTVTQIAADCGFNSSTYFTTVFRQLKGISPRILRQTARQNAFPAGTSILPR